MYYGSGTVATPHVHSPDGSTPAWNDVMAAILKVWHQVEIATPSIDAYITWTTIPPDFIPIRFETTEPRAIFEELRPNNKMNGDMGSVSDPKSNRNNGAVINV